MRKHLVHDPKRRHTEILPLFARLSQAEQDRVFDTGGPARIVLATNVAETSLTVPGIRYVIDAGLARVKRYSYRNKVEQLQVEPISQAAANQRAGRCGRVAGGTCIRLYDEADFAARPRFTDPEILRSSLAGVILRMKALGLGLVEEFPFLEPPPKKAVVDGYALLGELGAVDEQNELTAIGRELARLPLDPRIGRMIVEARNQGSLAEVLVIAAALSGQDVRDRPQERAQAADEKHKPFDDERSEFIGTLKLWQWIDAGRGHGAEHKAHKLSGRQQEQRLREHFISPRRVREWRDIHSQLLTVVAEHGWHLNTAPASYEQIHLALLAGLLGNIGIKADDEDWYLGARGIKFWRHPGANLSKKPGRWLMAAELVETTTAVRARPGGDRAGMGRTHRRSPAEDATARAALGKEGRRSRRARTRHAVWPGDLQQPQGQLRPHRRRCGARDLHSRGAGRRRLGHQAALPGAQPEADPPGAGARTQGAAARRAGR